MPSLYTALPRVSAPILLPSDLDLNDGPAFASPLSAVADRARYAAAIASGTLVHAPLVDINTGAPLAIDARDVCATKLVDASARTAYSVVHVVGSVGPSSGGMAIAYETAVDRGWVSVPFPAGSGVIHGVCYDPVIGWIACGGPPSTGNAFVAQSASPTIPIFFNTQSSNSPLALRGCASNGAGVVVCVGDGSGGAPHIERTTTGVTFAAQSAGVTGNLVRVAFAAGIFVAVGNVGGTTPLILRSADGITWTQCAVSGASSGVAAVAHDGTRWVAITQGGQVLFSTNGQAWSGDGANRLGASLSDGNGLRRALAADPVSGVLLAQGGGAPMEFGLARSMDGGATWEDILPAATPANLLTADITAIAFGSRRFIGVGLASSAFTTLAR